MSASAESSLVEDSPADQARAGTKQRKAARQAASEIVIVANRLPVKRTRRGSETKWETSPGGLVSALTPILQRQESTWVGWPGFTGPVPAPFRHESIDNRPVPLSRDEVHSFYEGFANCTLWPLYHDCVRTPQFHRKWWWPYVEVNQRFAEAAAEVVAPSGTVWVHDYHLQLVPAMLRELRPDVRIGFFLHIPFPPRELLSQIPWRRQIVDGLLGADLIGFQTEGGADNFAECAQLFTTASGEAHQLNYEGRTIRVGAFPISIDVGKFESLAGEQRVHASTERLRKRLGTGRKIVLGVDRMDYTKGIDIRLRAFQELLRSGRAKLEECVFVQVAVPSRERVDEYRELRSQVERRVGEINGEFSQVGLPPVHYLHRSFPVDELVALYRSADVMVVTPLRDGMNLVAKEYVATRLDDTGVLVLSEFTGSASELQTSLLVNPHDIDGVAAAIERALHMPPDEQSRRMSSMRKSVRGNDVFHWANAFFDALIH